MEIFLSWVVLSVVVGAIGAGRKIGFGSAFLLSLFLSPLIGLIVTLTSKTDEQAAFEKKTIEIQRLQVEKTEQLVAKSDADEMRKLKALLDEGIISWEEFTALKEKLLKGES